MKPRTPERTLVSAHLFVPPSWPTLSPGTAILAPLPFSREADYSLVVNKSKGNLERNCKAPSEPVQQLDWLHHANFCTNSGCSLFALQRDHDHERGLPIVQHCAELNKTSYMLTIEQLFYGVTGVRK
jgi:hypothetical protein